MSYFPVVVSWVNKEARVRSRIHRDIWKTRQDFFSANWRLWDNAYILWQILLTCKKWNVQLEKNKSVAKMNESVGPWDNNLLCIMYSRKGKAQQGLPWCRYKGVDQVTSDGQIFSGHFPGWAWKDWIVFILPNIMPLHKGDT